MLAIVTCYFNPANWPKLRANYLGFREALGEIPLFTAELSFDGTFFVEDSLKFHGNRLNTMWQKERLLNLVAESLPACYDKVAWIDADLIFDNPDWYKEASKLLDDYPAVQLCSQFSWEGVEWDSCAFRNFKEPSKWGGCWGYRRDILPWYDGAVMGGGDKLMVWAYRGMFERGIVQNPAWARHYLKWAATAYRKVKGHIGCVEGVCTHLPHGEKSNRQYNERYKIIADMNPHKDLRTASNGLWEWTTDKYVDDIKEFFIRRQDG